MALTVGCTHRQWQGVKKRKSENGRYFRLGRDFRELLERSENGHYFRVAVTYRGRGEHYFAGTLWYITYIADVHCLFLTPVKGFVPGGAVGTPYNGLYGEAPTERGIHFRLEVHKRVEISRVVV